MISYPMLVHLFQTNVWFFNLFLVSPMPMKQLALEYVILKFYTLSTRLSLRLSWKNRHWSNAHRTTLTTLRLFLLRKTTLLTFLLLTPAETNKTLLAVAADAASHATIVVYKLTVIVVVKEDVHIIIKMGYGIRRGYFLFGSHGGSHWPLLLALILPLEIGNSHSL